MNNINTKEYWENRFYSGSWNKAGQRQTREYAKANVQHMNLSSDFDGIILDFGCAQGDAIPVYAEAFPKAKIHGIDISESAIETCKKRFGDIAEFTCGDFNIISEKDAIIASHVMEHLSDDKSIIRNILPNCKNLFVFVPYKENPLYHEHVNYYEDDYYNDFNVVKRKPFTVSYQYKCSLRQVMSNFRHGKFSFVRNFSKEIIMFQIKGLIQ